MTYGVSINSKSLTITTYITIAQIQPLEPPSQCTKTRLNQNSKKKGYNPETKHKQISKT